MDTQTPTHARKRSSTSITSDSQDPPNSKRQRTATIGKDAQLTKHTTASAPEADAAGAQPQPKTTAEPPPYCQVDKSTAEDVGRDGLQRAVALALQHVGFDGASREAMESFTEVADTYITRFVDHLKHSAHAARRENPTPADYQTVLRRHNVPLSHLKRHLRHPIPKHKLEPSTYNPFTEDTSRLELPLPFLGDELDGREEKEEKAWIPKSFPGFPSKHTYKFTPAEKKVADTQEKRTQAAADSRKGEVALRRIDRAAKISRQKELREMADRNPLSRQRHQAWEAMMKDFIPRTGGTRGGVEIADHSTVVNADAKHLRQEVPRVSRRAAGGDSIQSKG